MVVAFDNVFTHLLPGLALGYAQLEGNVFQGALHVPDILIGCRDGSAESDIHGSAHFQGPLQYLKQCKNLGWAEMQERWQGKSASLRTAGSKSVQAQSVLQDEPSNAI